MSIDAPCFSRPSATKLTFSVAKSYMNIRDMSFQSQAVMEQKILSFGLHAPRQSDFLEVTLWEGHHKGWHIYIYIYELNCIC